MRIFFFVCLPLLGLHASYKWDAKAYAESSTLQKTWIIEAISGYRFEGNEKILDVGSADGMISFLLSQKVQEGSVLGVDISESMFEYATKQWKRENLQFTLHDIVTFSTDEKFDLATFFFTFEWIDQKEKAIANCSKLLAPKGQIWMLTPVEIPKEVIASAEHVAGQMKWSAFFENFVLPTGYISIKDTYNMLIENELYPVYMQTKKKKMIFSSRENFTQMLRATLPHLEALPEDLKDEYMAELIDKYVEILPPDRYHRITLYLEIFEVIGAKR